MTPRALAASPIDFVSAVETVRVQQNFINGLMFTRIDFWSRLRNCAGWRSQPRTPRNGGRARRKQPIRQLAETKIWFAEQLDNFIRSELIEQLSGNCSIIN